MATANPFDLLGGDDAEEPSLLIAAQQLKAESKKAADPSFKEASGGAKSAKAKLPSKPPPPAQAVKEAKSESARGGRDGGRGGRGRGGGVGFYRESSHKDDTYENKDFSSAQGAPEAEGGRPLIERRGGYGGPREPSRGGYDGSREPFRGRYDGPREPSRGGYDGPREPSRGGYDGPREPFRGGYDGPREPSRGGYDGPREPSRGGYDGPREPSRGGYNGPREPSRGGYDGPREPSRGGYDGPREPSRGGRRGGFSNGEAREGDRNRRRQYDRHSGTGQGDELKKEGAGQGNWGTETDELAPLAEGGVEDEKIVIPEKQLSVEENGAAEGAQEAPKNDVKVERPQVKEMTLDEYEKVLEEKRKALQAVTTEFRKIDPKEFESMQPISNKKTNADIFIKLGSDGNRDKKKELVEKEERAKKCVSINEFLKPAKGERYVNPGGRGRGRGFRGGGGGRGGDAGGGGEMSNARELYIEDPGQFPSLGGK